MLVQGTGFNPYSAATFTRTERFTRAEEAKEIASFSQAVKDFTKIKEQVIQAPDIRADKIGEIKDNYRTGTYFVNCEEIAAKIILEA